MNKILSFILVFIFLTSVSKGDPQHTYEAMFTLINKGTSWNVTFKFEAVSVRWDDDYNLTTGYATGQDEAENPVDEAGFDLIIDHQAGINSIMALGKYKISAWEGGYEIAYFYIDWRTTGYASHGPDCIFEYDVSSNIFYVEGETASINTETVTVWDLNEEINHVTTGFEPYAPVNLSSSTYNDRPKISWQRASTQDYVTGYEIYRSFISPNIGYTKIGSSTTTSFVDFDLSAGSGYTAFYKIKAVNGTKLSDYSSHLSVSYSGFLKTSNGTKDDNDITYEYSLRQNYPNPFNPSTTINYGSIISLGCFINILVLQFVFD